MIGYKIKLFKMFFGVEFFALLNRNISCAHKTFFIGNSNCEHSFIIDRNSLFRIDRPIKEKSSQVFHCFTESLQVETVFMHHKGYMFTLYIRKFNFQGKIFTFVIVIHGQYRSFQYPGYRIVHNTLPLREVCRAFVSYSIITPNFFSKCTL